MKKTLFLLAGLAFAATANAQTEPATPTKAKTEVKVRDNGTVKTTTPSGKVTKTGKTNVGQALDNTKDAAGNVARKTGTAVKTGAKKTAHAVKSGTQKAGTAVANGTEKLEAKTE